MKVSFFERFCIPSPVIGGLLFAIISCILYVTGVAVFSFDEIIRDLCMVFFFTCVGFHADMKTLKSGGKALVLYSLCIGALIVCQNIISIGLSKVLNINPLVGLCAGSISLVGGHGTSGAFGPVLEAIGLEGATTFCTAAANMQALCKQYVPSVKAFLIVPVVGGIILDFMNSILITFFINVIG